MPSGEWNSQDHVQSQRLQHRRKRRPRRTTDEPSSSALPPLLSYGGFRAAPIGNHVQVQPIGVLSSRYRVSLDDASHSWLMPIKANQRKQNRFGPAYGLHEKVPAFGLVGFASVRHDEFPQVGGRRRAPAFDATPRPSNVSPPPVFSPRLLPPLQPDATAASQLSARQLDRVAKRSTRAAAPWPVVAPTDG